MRFIGNCVGWPENDVHAEGGLCDMIAEASDITRATFLRNVGLENVAPIAEGLGYVANAKQGLTMAGDYHVSYHRSKLHGKRVYFFKHSAIEYVFAEFEDDAEGAAAEYAAEAELV
jgi:hypothetical protein